MPHNNYQPTSARRCIALTKSGSQCKNTINCFHHRCHKRACTERHTNPDIPLTPLSIRQEYMTPAWSDTTSTSGSTNGNGHRGTSRVSPSPHEMPNQNNTHRQNPLFPDGSSKISETNAEDDNGHDQSSGPGHTQPSRDVHARRSSVQPPSIKKEDTRILHEEHDIAGPLRAREPIQRSDQPFKGLDTPLLDSAIDDTMFRSPIFDPIVPDLNPESGVTAKGKDKDRSETETKITHEKRESVDTLAADWADFFTLKTPIPSSQPPTQSSPADPNQSRNPTPGPINPNDTARESVTPSPYDSEPSEQLGEPHSFPTTTESPFQSADLDRVSGPAPEWAREADRFHGMTPERMVEIAQQLLERARRANSELNDSSI